MKMKKRVCLLLLLILFGMMQGYATETVNVYLNGEQLVFDVQPYTVNDRTMVPIRTLLEKIDAVVSYESNLIMITKGDKLIVMGIGLDYALVNSEQLPLDAAPVLKDNRTLAPLRFLCEQFEMDVQWDESTNSVMITEGK